MISRFEVRTLVVLSGGLSNSAFGDLVHFLESREARKGPLRRKTPQAGWPDGGRKFGTVRDAIVTVMARAGGEMRVRDIHLEVQKELRGQVSRFSVADYLRVRSQPPKPVFARTRHGHYTLLG